MRGARWTPLGTVSGVVLLTLILASAFADVLAPYDDAEANPAVRLQGASAQHPLGTDQLGRDLLTRLPYGARISFRRCRRSGLPAADGAPE